MGSVQRFIRSLNADLFDHAEVQTLAEQRRTNDLLAGIAGAVGADTDDAEAFEAVPREVVRIPQDSSALALPPGETRIKFRSGSIRSQEYGDVGSVTSLRTLTEQNPERIDRMRAVALTADDEVQVQVEDRESVRITPGEVVTVDAPAIHEVSLYAGRACRVAGFASTRPSVDVTQRPVDVRRVGRLPDDAATRVRWAPGPVVSRYDGAEHGPTDWGDPEVLVGGMRDVTVSVANVSGDGTNADVTLYGANTGDTGTVPTWRALATVSGLADGDHHLFTVDQSWRRLKLEAVGSSGGSIDVDAELGGTA